MAGGRRASSSVGCSTRRRVGAAGRRGDDGSVPLSRRAAPELESENGIDLIWVEWSRRGNAVAAEGGRRWGEAE
jgi:hypothetical protein